MAEEINGETVSFNELSILVHEATQGAGVAIADQVALVESQENIMNRFTV